MLGLDHQHGRRENDLSLERIGALCGGQRGSPIPLPGPKGVCNEWVNRTLRQQDYGQLKRGGKGLVRRYIAKMTGLSRAQAARLIRSYQQGGESEAASLSAASICQSLHPGRYRSAGRRDEAHETLSGPATQKILQRAWPR